MNTPTGADFRAIRMLLGLSVNDAVDLLEVNHRTINRWEREEFKVPGGVYQELLDLLNFVEERVDAALEVIDDMGESDQIKLLVYDNQPDFARYCPKEVPKLKLYSVHMAMCSRILFENQDKVSLVRFHAADYEFWLDGAGLVDSQEARSTWAGQQ